MGLPRAADLRAGDVLLVRSPGAVAWATRLFDGAEVDRAALYLGAERVADAAGDTLAVRTLDESLAKAEHAVARRLKAPVSMEPVLARAEALWNERSAAPPEAVLALLCVSRKPRGAPSLRAVQRAALEAAGSLRGTSPLTDAQFVWRSFDDALPEPTDVYTIGLNDLHNLEVVSGVPVVPGAGVARRLGRGVHPDSLLAWAAQPLVRARMASVAEGDPPLALDEAIARYRREVPEGAPAAPPARAESDALLASLQKFAAAWAKGSPPLARSVLPPQLEMLFRSAADLCSAGDLMRSEDLFTLQE